MNLAQYSKMDKEKPTGAGEFLGFEHGQTRYLRFLYESGGENLGEDIKIVWKKWNPETRKYDSVEGVGSRRTILNCIEYNEDGSNPRHVRLDISAYICETTFMSAWKNYNKIIDGVWKVTCSNPKTKELSYSLFPIINADVIKYPIIEKETKSETTKETKPEGEPKKKKYWD